MNVKCSLPVNILKQNKLEYDDCLTHYLKFFCRRFVRQFLSMNNKHINKWFSDTSTPSLFFVKKILACLHGNFKFQGTHHIHIIIVIIE